MNNLLEEVRLGKEGKRIGGTTGSLILDACTLGIRKGVLGGVVAKEKVGKSKWVRYHYIVAPYIHGILKEKEYRWLLFSLEEPRVKVEADICSALIYHFYGEKISRNLMLGIAIDEYHNPIVVTDAQEQLIEKVYNDHIIPLFGTWTSEGQQITPGLIQFEGNKVTPSQYQAKLEQFAALNGDLKYANIPEITESGTTRMRKEIVNFVPHDADMIPIVIMDDYRLMRKESGTKDTIDRALEVEVDITQKMKWFFFMGILHLNRDLTNFERIASIGKNMYYPDTSLIKDTGNFGERKHLFLLYLIH